MIVPSRFRPASWLPGPHLQTLWPVLFRRRPRPPFHRERLELPDGDFLDLDWLGEPQRARGVLLILHGLEGSSGSHYARGLASRAAAAGWAAVVMHFRGCSGEPNRLPRSYHSGESGDLDHVARLLRSRFPDRRLAAAGFSLGGNVLAKWLGECGSRVPLDGACAVSVPFVLAAAARRLESGASRLYQWHLLRQLRRSLLRKGARVALPLDLAELPRLRSFRRFDDRVTARLHGFAGVDDYYARASCRPWLGRVAVPLLLVQARDDPFFDPAHLPRAAELSPTVTLELSPRGGHVGFIGGRWPWRPEYWLEGRVVAFLETLTAAPERG